MYSSHKRNPAILCRRVWKPYCFVSLLSANADLALYSQSFKETLDTRILLAGTKTRLKCYFWNESYHRLVQCFRPESPKDASWTLYREGEVGQKNPRLAACLSIGLNLTIGTLPLCAHDFTCFKSQPNQSPIWNVIELLSLQLHSPPYDRLQAPAPQPIEGFCCELHPKDGRQWVLQLEAANVYVPRSSYTP